MNELNIIKTKLHLMKIFNVPPKHVGEITSEEAIGGTTLPEWGVYLKRKSFEFAVLRSDYGGCLVLRMNCGPIWPHKELLSS
jgi:hypothetical protein